MAFFVIASEQLPWVSQYSSHRSAVSRSSYPKPQSSHWNTVPTFRSSSFTIPQPSGENRPGAEIRIACNSWGIILCSSGNFKFDCFSAKCYENGTGVTLADVHSFGYRNSTIRSYQPIATHTTLEGWNRTNDSLAYLSSTLRYWSGKVNSHVWHWKLLLKVKLAGDLA